MDQDVSLSLPKFALMILIDVPSSQVKEEQANHVVLLLFQALIFTNITDMIHFKFSELSH